MTIDKCTEKQHCFLMQEFSNSHLFMKDVRRESSIATVISSNCHSVTTVSLPRGCRVQCQIQTPPDSVKSERPSEFHLTSMKAPSNIPVNHKFVGILRIALKYSHKTHLQNGA
jgi:hypothetical protein